MEEYALAVIAAGLLIATLGHLWLIVRGWKVRWLWGVGFNSTDSVSPALTRADDLACVTALS